ncbi:hypothetical protein NDU88_002818, partial [Pleurodeles waltl]
GSSDLACKIPGRICFDVWPLELRLEAPGPGKLPLIRKDSSATVFPGLLPALQHFPHCASSEDCNSS